MTWSRRKITPAEAPAHFWSRVRKSDGCWEWSGSLTSAGYGHTGYLGRTRLAHRIAWELTNGPIPAGMQLCHHCDNPPCCRPDHLFIGTASDNRLDSMAKGRSIRKTHCHRGHALTEDNLYRSKNGTRNGCKTCTRDDVNARYARWIASGRTPAEWKAKKGTAA